jgi:hypothetical protein
MKHRLYSLLGLTLALLAAATTASAQSIWKWRDASGRMQISDRAPPVDVPDKDILQRPGAARSAQPAAPAASAASEAITADPTLEARRKKLQQEQAAQKQGKEAADAAEQERRAAQRADACKRAQSYQKALESGQRVARPNERGEREVLDDASRNEELTRAREAVSSQCN